MLISNSQFGDLLDQFHKLKEEVNDLRQYKLLFEEFADAKAQEGLPLHVKEFDNHV